jgi:hypothetical protein
MPEVLGDSCGDAAMGGLQVVAVALELEQAAAGNLRSVMRKSPLLNQVTTMMECIQTLPQNTNRQHSQHNCNITLGDSGLYSSMLGAIPSFTFWLVVGIHQNDVARGST